MKLNDVKKLSPLDRLIYWVRERESIRVAKEAGRPAPWSDDPIFQTTYFTNVRREDDKVTRWYAANIRTPLKADPRVVFATIAFRWFNWIPTGEVLTRCWASVGARHTHRLRECLEASPLCDWDTPAVVGLLSSRQERGEQVFTGAFNISNSGSTKPKINRVCEDYIQPVWEDHANLQTYFAFNHTLEHAHWHLSRYPGLGGSGFMAAQVIADLKYTGFLKEAKDWHTWCCLGPGSKRGLLRLLGLPLTAKVPRDWPAHLNLLRNKVNSSLPEKWHLHAQDMQSCLCEYDKYIRVLLDEGRSKRTYPGRG